MPTPVAVTLYTREGCHLCEAAREAILRGAEGFAIELREVDVDADAELARRFGEEVPVVFIGDRKAFKFRLTPEQFRDRLRRRLEFG
ncbi:MAG TPA: glutaredoxin family protein [Planctomycetota bacterium]|jgi:glutaredoxin|nr:glutaredoxin family protein [Planctomycetota bacterium]